ncbi:hypothetical protein SDC9_72972 [bioreactor metagenome]|uniref:26 kDa periplasmic immunogenic protein n=1 Tax=bioreactor metagenome TaxID=1076179 RepID=A0A644YD96_9ZZZZ
MSGNAVKTIAATALLVCAGAVSAQNAGGAGAGGSPQNVLQLSASSSVEVQQDRLVLRLSANRDGAEAAKVQAQLKQILDAALSKAKADAKPQQMEVRTGEFSLYPRYNNEKISGWQGRAELILEGKDFSLITATAGAVQNMTISAVAFDLSREAREKVEDEVQAKAIAAFKAKAAETAKQFGFAGYTLREVAVNDSRGQVTPPMYGRAGAGSLMKMASDSSVPVEAGKARVEVSVSGTIQMR